MSETCDYCGCSYTPRDGATFRVTVEVGDGELTTDICSQACLTAYAVAGPLVEERGRP